jgi:flagellar export protein FliJ
VRAFRFRAQAALDLRQREHDAARRALAQAESEQRAAQRALDEAVAAIERAEAEAAALWTGTEDRQRFEWYRSWIVRLRHERDACGHILRLRGEEVARATEASKRTKQRVESLDRLRERAWQAWTREAQAREQKEIDTVATIRFVASRGSDALRGWSPAPSETSRKTGMRKD